jgi:multiple sugar transport system substrate-binding protein
MDPKQDYGRLSRRDFMKLGASGAAALLLARCAPAATPEPSTPGSAPVSAPPKSPVTVDFLAWGDNADVPAWDKLSKLYMERNSHVTVKVTTVADPAPNFYPKLQTMIAGGTPPDVSSFQGWEWQTYADKDLLAPVDDYVARDNFSAAYPETFKSVKDSTVRDGKRYLIPLQLGTMVMFYAKKHFDEAGLPYPTDDWTFEEFLDIAQKLTDTSGTDKKYGLQANGNWFRDIGWIRATGKQEFDSIVDPKKAMFNQPEIVDMIQTVASDCFYSLGFAPSPADLSGGANAFDTGNCAMKYEGPWWFPRMNSPELRSENKQIEFDVVLMPVGADKERPHRGWAEGVCLVKGKKIEDAWGFASFMAGDEGDKIYCEITGRVPNNPALLESFWLPTIEERFQVKNGKAFIKALEHSEVDVVGGVPRSLMWSEIVKPVGWDPLVNGSATAKEVLPKVDEALQAKLDEYWASV